jgi:hypothetical protein
MSITEDTAVAQIKLPGSKIVRKHKYVHFSEKYW